MHPLSEPEPTYSHSLTGPEPAPEQPHSRTETRAHHITSGPGGCRRLSCALPTGATADENSPRRHTIATQSLGLSASTPTLVAGCLGSRSGTVGGEAYACICRQHPAGTVISWSGERHVIGMDEDQASGTRREAAIHSTYLRRRRHRYGGGGGVAQAGRPDLDLHCLY